MGSSDTEAARRVLAAVLKRLEGGESGPVTFDRPATSAAAGRGDGAVAENAAAPDIVILIVNDDGAHSPDGVGRSRFAAGSATAPPTLEKGHPALERFAFPEDLLPASAAHECVLEPGRACVNSGACQMRGH